jgi:hypothetical protein
LSLNPNFSFDGVQSTQEPALDVAGWFWSGS